MTLLAAATGTLAGRGLTLVLTFAAGVAAARLLGPSLRGELALMMIVPGVAAPILGSGLDMANLALASRSSGLHAAVVHRSLTYATVSGLGAAGCLVAVGAFLPGARLGLPLSAFIGAAALIPTTLGIILLGAAEAGRGRPWLPNLITAMGMLAYLLGLALLWLSDSADVLRVFVVFGVGQLITFTGLLFAVRHLEKALPDRLTWRDYLSVGLGGYLSNVALLLLLRLDIPLLQVVSSPAQVGLYATVLPMGEAILLIPAALTLVVLPRRASGELSRLRLVELSRVIALVAVLGAATGAVMAPWLVPVVFGPDFAAASGVLVAMLPGIAALAASRPLYLDLIATRRFGSATITAVVALIVAVPLKISLISSMGAVGGAASASVVWIGYAMALWYLTVPREGAHSLLPFLPTRATGMAIARSVRTLSSVLGGRA